MSGGKSDKIQLRNKKGEEINPATEDTLLNLNSKVIKCDTDNIRGDVNAISGGIPVILSKNDTMVVTERTVTIDNIDKAFDRDYTTYAQVTISPNGELIFALRRPMTLYAIGFVTSPDTALQNATFFVNYDDGTTDNPTPTIVTDYGARIPVNPNKRVLSFGVKNETTSDISFQLYELHAFITSQVTLVGTDIEIGAVEVKNDIDDTRLKIESDNTARVGIYDTTGTRINPLSEEGLAGLKYPFTLAEDTTEVAVTETAYTLKKTLSYNLMQKNIGRCILQWTVKLRGDGTNIIYFKLVVNPGNLVVYEASTSSSEYITIRINLLIPDSPIWESLKSTSFQLYAYVNGGTGYVGDDTLTLLTRNYPKIPFRQRVSVTPSSGGESVVTVDITQFKSYILPSGNYWYLGAIVEKVYPVLPRNIMLESIGSMLDTNAVSYGYEGSGVIGLLGYGERRVIDNKFAVDIYNGLKFRFYTVGTASTFSIYLEGYI